MANNPLYTPSPVDPNLTIMFPNMRGPFAQPAPAAPALQPQPITPADRAYSAATGAADAQLRSFLPSINTAMSPADRAYWGAMNPPAAAPVAASAPAAPRVTSTYAPPAVDQNLQPMLRNMQMPNDAHVAPNSFGGASGVPPAPVAAAPAAKPVGPAPSAAPAFAPTNAATAADKSYYAAAKSSPPLFPPQSPEVAAQTAADHAALVGGATKLGAAAADVVSMPARAVMGVANTLLRVPNAMGANIPYIPENWFGGSSSSLTPYYDKYVTGPEQAAAKTAAAAPAATAPLVGPVNYSPDRLARAGVGADGGRLVNDPTAGAPPAAAGGAVAGGGSGAPGGVAGGGLRDPYAAINAGFSAQENRANTFMNRALDYINGGSDIFDRATRGRAIGNILSAVMGPNNQGAVMGQGADAFNNALAGMANANTYARASMHGADMGLLGQLAATGERASEFAQTPLTTGAEANPMGPYYPNLPSYSLPGGIGSNGQAQAPRPVGGAAARQEAAKPKEGQTGKYQGQPVVYRNGQWQYAN